MGAPRAPFAQFSPAGLFFLRRPHLERASRVVHHTVHLDVLQFDVAAVIGAHGVAKRGHRVALAKGRAGPVRPRVPSAPAQLVVVRLAVCNERREAGTPGAAFRASKSFSVDHSVNYVAYCNFFQPINLLEHH